MRNPRLRVNNANTRRYPAPLGGNGQQQRQHQQQEEESSPVASPSAPPPPALGIQEASPVGAASDKQQGVRFPPINQKHQQPDDVPSTEAVSSSPPKPPAFAPSPPQQQRAPLPPQQQQKQSPERGAAALDSADDEIVDHGSQHSSSSHAMLRHHNPHDHHHDVVKPEDAEANLTRVESVRQPTTTTTLEPPQPPRHLRTVSNNSNHLSMSACNSDDELSESEIEEARTTVNAYQIQQAYSRIKQFGLKLPTPVTNATHLLPGFRSIHVKNEQLFRTGSFKERGALNFLSLFRDREVAAGAITASAGNHSSAVALWAKRLSIPFKCVMPAIAPLTKVQQCLSFGAEVMISGDNLEQSRLIAMEESEKTGKTYIHGFSSAPVVAGAGSCGIEILEQVPDVQVILVPAGGCGLLAGVACAVKQRNPNCKVIAIESAACPGFAESRKAGKVVRVPLAPTLCDGAHVPVIGELSFQVANPLVDEAIVVEERWVAQAMVLCMERLKVVLEGSAALGIAAMMSGQLDHYRRSKIVSILSGGNIDMNSVGKVIERALLLDQRTIRVKCEILDSPGSMATFLTAVATAGGSVKDIQQERGIRSGVWIRCLVETRGKQHAQEVEEKMREAGYNFIVDKVE